MTQGAATAPRRAKLASLGLALLLSGCANADLVIDASSTMLASGGTGGSPAFASNTPRRAGAARHILVLTSGGADGAFGAGVIRSWTASGRRPQFDIVSGTSTGALQATAAFLGPDYDGLLERVYTSTQTRDILRPNGLKTLLGTGLYDPAPLRRLLEEVIDESMLDAVAAAHAAGRRLYVTTTDMTAGRSVVWDMGAIASSQSDRKSAYIGVLVASAAVPGLVEPVYVRDQEGKVAVHSDGGVKTPVPLEPFMLKGRRAIATHVWVIANGHVSRDTALRSEARNALGLARRGITQLIRQLLYTSVQEAEGRARRAGGRFHLVSLPTSVPEAANPLDFRPEELRGLYETGRTIGQLRFGPPADATAHP